MNTKTSIVKDIKSAGEPYTGQYGTLYGFYITFENGDNGKYNSKSQDQTKFVIGQEATYDYIPREYNGKTYYTVKPVNPEYAGNSASAPRSSGSGGTTSKDELIVRQTALKAASELGGTPEVVLKNAQLFTDWVLAKPAAQASASHAQHFAGREEVPSAPAPGDDLPF